MIEPPADSPALGRHLFHRRTGAFALNRGHLDPERTASARVEYGYKFAQREHVFTNFHLCFQRVSRNFTF
jgi:hypothetical protein